MNVKAQSSTEYLIIAGFVAVITVPLILVYMAYSDTINDSIIANQIDKVARKIVDAAESVYYLGEPSQTTIKVYIPERIVDVQVGNREVFYRIRTSKGISDIVQISPVNMTGSLPTSQGVHFIIVKAQQNAVILSYT